MLLGLYTSTLDTHNQLTLPDKFMGQFNDGFCLIRGFDRNIMMLTTNAFDVIYQRITSTNIADPLARLLLRLMLGSANKSETLSDGIITITEELKDYAHLEKEVIWVGQGDFIELWSPENWKKQLMQVLDVEANTNRFSSLSISIR